MGLRTVGGSAYTISVTKGHLPMTEETTSKTPEIQSRKNVGIAIDAQSNIYVVESANSRIQKFLLKND